MCIGNKVESVNMEIVQFEYIWILCELLTNRRRAEIVMRGIPGRMSRMKNEGVGVLKKPINLSVGFMSGV